MVTSGIRQVAADETQNESIQKLLFAEGLVLENGQKLNHLEIAYQT